MLALARRTCVACVHVGTMVFVSSGGEETRGGPASTATFRLLAETVSCPAWLAERDGTVVFLNRGACLFAGITDAERPSAWVWACIVHPEDRAAFLAAWSAARAAASPFQAKARLRAVDGSYRWHVHCVTPELDAGGAVVRWVGLSTELPLTAEADAEAALRRERDRFARIAATAPGVIHAFRRGPDGRHSFPFATSRIAELYGGSPEDLAEDASPVFSRIHPEDVPRVVATIDASARGMTPWREEFRFRHDTRGERWIEGHSMPVAEPDGAIVWHGVLSDVTERKREEGERERASVELRRRDELLRSVLASVPDAVITAGEDGRVVSTNAATSRLFGYAPQELVGMDVMALVPSRAGSGVDLRARRKDGTTFPVEVRITTFDLEGARHLTAVVRDVSDRRALEEQFRQAHKMEAFGQLAGGVAHDFNNMLTVILSEVEAILACADPGGEVAIAADGIRDAGERAASLTRQLLAFSRKTVLEPKVVDLNAVVSETQKMLARLLGEEVVLETSLSPDLRPVHVDTGLFGQVLVNLAVNARDAMPTGGRLRISTANEGRHVRLTVEDDGEGMSPDVQASAFQPFFTTKGVGRGTGLGLAVVDGIVAQSGGTIALVSAPGQGTRFDIRLPPAEADAGAEVSPSPSLRSLPGPGTSVLVVEDDDAVRAIAVRALERLGCRVLCARDGAEALALAEENAPSLGAVVTDVVMPAMSGRVLADRLRERHPDLKVLFTTGYTDEVVVRHGVRSDTADLLPKPYTPAELTRALANLLGAA